MNGQPPGYLPPTSLLPQQRLISPAILLVSPVLTNVNNLISTSITMTIATMQIQIPNRVSKSPFHVQMFGHVGMSRGRWRNRHAKGPVDHLIWRDQRTLRIRLSMTAWFEFAGGNGSSWSPYRCRRQSLDQVLAYLALLSVSICRIFPSLVYRPPLLVVLPLLLLIS